MICQSPVLDERLKAILFDKLLFAQIETLICIDPGKRHAQTLYTGDDLWRMTGEDLFLYEETLQRYILEVCVDTRPADILERMHIDSVAEVLKEKGSECVLFTVRGGEYDLRVKEALFFPGDGTDIMLCIRDMSEAYMNVTENLEMLKGALSEAERENERKNEFLSMLSDRLRTPLYSIMGLVHIAEQEAGNHSFDDYLHKISMSGSFMKETIDDVLSLRQIAGHKIEMYPVMFQLRDFFAFIGRMIRPVIASKGMIYKEDLSNVADLQVEADNRVLGQIVMKMLRIAIGSTVRGGRIRLYGRTRRLSDTQVELELSVENRGLTIDAERLSLLFKPDDYIRERPDEGISELDVSLVILRSNLLAMGCDLITAESDKQKGTRIGATLRLATTPDVKEASESFFIPDFNGKRVLIVDDNEISLEVSEKLLTAKGVEVVKASNGKEALTAYEQSKGRFDLILMDILMPGMSGLEVTRRIRSMPEIPGSDRIPIIALTVNAFRHNFEESLQAGMNEHIVKPIDPDIFYRILTKYLG